MKKILSAIVAIITFNSVSAQEDTIPVHDLLIVPDTAITPDTVIQRDTALRIIGLNPYFTIHVDSTFRYQPEINKKGAELFWYLRNAPVGLRINKDNGVITFKADKSFFLSGKLKFDVDYPVNIGVQNRKNPEENIDTSFTIVFYNTEIILSKVKPTVGPNVWIQEGDKVSFRVVCDNGNFPIENILTLTTVPINNYQIVQKCGDEFYWSPSYDVVSESDSGKVEVVDIHFIGSTKFQMKDTATIRIIVKDALNYPLANEEYIQTVKNVNRYVVQLKYTFLLLDRSLKKTKSIRTTFDLTSATTSLTGTIMSGSKNDETQRTGQILPSIGLALVPIKEAAVPSKIVDQNQAAAIRTSIKRLEYMLQDNQLVGQKDPDVIKKTNKLREELKQVQLQLIEVPVEITNDITEEELNRYFNSPRVNKKYRLRS